MKILLISNLYPPGFVGGYEIGASRTAEALAALGHDVLVLTRGEDSEPPPVRRGLVVGRCLRFDRRAHGFAGHDSAPAWNAARMGRAIGAFRPDIVWVWNPLHLGAELFPTLERIGVRTALCLSDIDVAASPMVPRDLPTAFVSHALRSAALPYGYSVARSVVLPHWVDLPAEAASCEGEEVLCTGQLVEAKGIRDLFEAAAGLGCRLTLVGTGNSILVRRWAEEVGLRGVVVTGPAAHGSMGAWYRKAAVAALPTHFFEAISIATLEALAWGLPTITTRLGGNAAYFDPEPLAYEVPPDDPLALREVLEFFLADIDRRREWGARARRGVAERFSREAVVPRIVEWLEGVAS